MPRFQLLCSICLDFSPHACSVLHLSPREDEVFFDVVAIVDPLTREAQKLAPLLIVSAVVNCVSVGRESFCAM